MDVAMRAKTKVDHWLLAPTSHMAINTEKVLSSLSNDVGNYPDPCIRR